jgi:hypothetical protein
LRVKRCAQSVDLTSRRRVYLNFEAT